MSGRVLSGHQPCYLASLGLFAKMKRSDIFMHCGHLQFQRSSWHNRNYILLEGKRHLLSIPIKRPHVRPIRDVIFSTREDWRRIHLKTLRQAYENKTPFFGRYYWPLKGILYSHPHSLERLNIELTDQIARWLGCETTVVNSVHLDLKGDAIEKIIQMCKVVGADTYLSNTGAEAYIRLKERILLDKAGIKSQWLRFEDPDEEPLSAIHHLFHLGPDAARLIQ